LNRVKPFVIVLVFPKIIGLDYIRENPPNPRHPRSESFDLFRFYRFTASVSVFPQRLSVWIFSVKIRPIRVIRVQSLLILSVFIASPHPLQVFPKDYRFDLIRVHPLNPRHPRSKSFDLFRFYRLTASVSGFPQRLSVWILSAYIRSIRVIRVQSLLIFSVFIASPHPVQVFPKFIGLDLIGFDFIRENPLNPRHPRSKSFDLFRFYRFTLSGCFSNCAA